MPVGEKTTRPLSAIQQMKKKKQQMRNSAKAGQLGEESAGLGDCDAEQALFAKERAEREARQAADDAAAKIELEQAQREHKYKRRPSVIGEEDEEDEEDKEDEENAEAGGVEEAEVGKGGGTGVGADGNAAREASPMGLAESGPKAVGPARDGDNDDDDDNENEMVL